MKTVVIGLNQQYNGSSGNSLFISFSDWVVFLLLFKSYQLFVFVSLPVRARECDDRVAAAQRRLALHPSSVTRCFWATAALFSTNYSS